MRHPIVTPAPANQNSAAGSMLLVERSGPERTALAMLRCGRSFAEAAHSSGVPVERLLELWRVQGNS